MNHFSSTSCFLLLSFDDEGLFPKAFFLTEANDDQKVFTQRAINPIFSLHPPSKRARGCTWQDQWLHNDMGDCLDRQPDAARSKRPVSEMCPKKGFGSATTLGR